MPLRYIPLNLRSGHRDIAGDAALLIFLVILLVAVPTAQQLQNYFVSIFNEPHATLAAKLAVGFSERIGVRASKK